MTQQTQLTVARGYLLQICYGLVSDTQGSPTSPSCYGLATGKLV